MIVVMCDGSSRGNPGPASVGIIIWNRMKGKGRIKRPTFKAQFQLGIKTNNEAEWLGIIKSAETVIEKKWHKQPVYIYTDSQLVYNQVNLKWAVKHDSMKKLFRKWQEIIHAIPDWSVVWVPRQLIYLADKEATKK